MLVKRKLYSVMNEEGNLGYYLYDEATGEEKLFAKRDLIDEEFLEEHEARKKNDRRSAKVGLTALGGVMGMYPGAYLKGGKGALAGAAIGAGLGYLGGKKIGKKSDEKYDKLRRKYESANKEEKKYLRHKVERELDRRNMRESAITAGYLAGR
jgi:hypothetical protein